METPYDAPEAIDLTDDKTLKDYGRRQHGLNGKDADLDKDGQTVITEAWWFPDSVRCTFFRYFTVGDEGEIVEPSVTLNYPVTYEDGDEAVLLAELHGKIAAYYENATDLYDYIDYPQEEQPA